MHACVHAHTHPHASAHTNTDSQETLHPDSYATSRGFPAGTQLDITHTPFRERADGSLSLNVLAATNTHDYNDLNNFIHLLVPPGENLRCVEERKQTPTHNALVLFGCSRTVLLCISAYKQHAALTAL